MKVLKVLSIPILCLAFLSFKTDDLTINENLFGTWFYISHREDIQQYESRRSFRHNEMGIKFKEDGSLVKRQNVGWCGTQPITYGNYNGNWEQTSDSTIIIRYKFGGGYAEQDWLIYHLGDEVLKFKVLDYRAYKKK